jgi:hypothetical protein
MSRGGTWTTGDPTALPELDVARVKRWCGAQVPEHARHQVRVERQVAPHKQDARHWRRGPVVNCSLADPGRPQAEDRCRLITTFLDPDAARPLSWPRSARNGGGSETTLVELKARQRGAEVVLHPKHSELGYRASITTSAG